MRRINGCTVVDQSEIDGILNVAGEDTGGAFSALIGTILAGAPAPALYEHPTTDEAFHCATREASFKLGNEQLTLRGMCGESSSSPPGDVEHEFVEV